jgi:hypothetical protein
MSPSSSGPKKTQTRNQGEAGSKQMLRSLKRSRYTDMLGFTFYFLWAM